MSKFKYRFKTKKAHPLYCVRLIDVNSVLTE